MTPIQRLSTRLLAVVAMTVTVLVGAATSAFAQAQDERARALPGSALTCEAAGLGGVFLNPGTDFSFSGGLPEESQFLNVLSVANGAKVSGIVVKGGPSYHVYAPGLRGLPMAAPWPQLRAPLNTSGNIPEISHWFVCGTPVGGTDTGNDNDDENSNGSGDGSGDGDGTPEPDEPEPCRPTLFRPCEPAQRSAPGVLAGDAGDVSASGGTSRTAPASSRMGEWPAHPCVLR